MEGRQFMFRLNNTFWRNQNIIRTDELLVNHYGTSAKKETTICRGFCDFKCDYKITNDATSS